jgi:hypothetical protein
MAKSAKSAKNPTPHNGRLYGKQLVTVIVWDELSEQTIVLGADDERPLELSRGKEQALRLELAGLHLGLVGPYVSSDWKMTSMAHADTSTVVEWRSIQGYFKVMTIVWSEWYIKTRRGV